MRSMASKASERPWSQRSSLRPWANTSVSGYHGLSTRAQYLQELRADPGDYLQRTLPRMRPLCSAQRRAIRGR